MTYDETRRRELWQAIMLRNICPACATPLAESIPFGTSSFTFSCEVCGSFYWCGKSPEEGAEFRWRDKKKQDHEADAALSWIRRQAKIFDSSISEDESVTQCVRIIAHKLSKVLPSGNKERVDEIMNEQKELSGNFITESRLEVFLYLLMRDHLPTGVVQGIVDSTEGESFELTNGWLGRYSNYLAQRINNISGMYGRGAI